MQPFTQSSSAKAPKADVAFKLDPDFDVSPRPHKQKPEDGFSGAMAMPVKPQPDPPIARRMEGPSKDEPRLRKRYGQFAQWYQFSEFPGLHVIESRDKAAQRGCAQRFTIYRHGVFKDFAHDLKGARKKVGILVGLISPDPKPDHAGQWE